MKRVPLLICLVLSVLSCAVKDGGNSVKLMQDGEWDGSGEGRNGLIVVRSTVSNHKLTKIRLISQSESPFAQESMQLTIDRALNKQDILTVDLDAVSGATLTSKGMIDAINMSIRSSRGEAVCKTEKYEDCECDIAVIGAGGAGLSAAVEAASRGKKVIVLEKMGIVGGNTNYSTGGLNAAETTLQNSMGIEDSKELFYQDTWEGGHRLGQPELIRSLVDNAAPTIDWLSGLGADFSDIGIMGGSSVKRTHRPKFGVAIGPHLIKTLHQSALDKGVEIRTSNEVKGLISEAGRVVGLNVNNSDGSAYKIKAGAVIIATGGFGANMTMVSAYRKDLEGMHTLSHRGATGDAFEWVISLGGALTQMNQIQVHPTAEAKSFILISEAVRGNGAILVNRDSRRFVNEMSTRDKVSKAILEQKGSTAFLIFDEELRKSLASIETYVQQGILSVRESISELAQAMDLDPEELLKCVERYNQMQAAGVDSDFGRLSDGMPRPVLLPPFYAVEVAPAIHHTMGGVSVNPGMQVLTSQNAAIPGLYAAGEVTGGLHGGNRLGGNGVADIVVNGKIAGREASAYTDGLAKAD